MEEDIMMNDVGNNCSQEVYKDLLNAILVNDFKKFEEILERGEYIDLEYTFGDPYYSTLLYFACENDSKINNRSDFVIALLKKGSNPNKINNLKKKAPIHIAVQKGVLTTVEAFFNCIVSDFNITDRAGDSPLHYAAKHDVPLNVLELILQRHDINVNQVNRKGKTPLYVALEQNNREAALELLKHRNINVKSGNLLNTNLKQLLNEIYPDWKSRNELGLVGNKKVTANDLFSVLHCGEYDAFLSLIKRNSQYLEANDGSHTILQFCCKFGLVNLVKELLLLNVDPNTTHNANLQTPVMIAASKGYVDIVNLLVNSHKCSFDPVKEETVLHCVVKGSAEPRGLGEEEIERDHLKCLSILLTVSRARLSINQGDLKKNTALHYAAKQGEHDMVLVLLKAGAYIGCCNKLGEPACADISRNTFEQFLNECIFTNDKLPREDTYEILFNYGCLNPDSLAVADDDIASQKSHNYESVIEPIYNSFESRPLLHITRNPELKNLLKHPLFTSFLLLKWYKIRKYFYFNLFFYLFFWALLTLYILCVYNNVSISKNNLRNSTFPNDSISNIENRMLWNLLTIFLLGLILRELLQCILSPLKYLLSLENWLEILIIAVTIKMLFFRSSYVAHQLSAIGIMSSWAELVLLIGRHPALSTNIEMFKTVSANFLKFLAWYSILIVAFALSFYTLFKDSNEGEDSNFFEDPALSVFKTVVMLTGEFDASAIPFIQQPGTSHILFVLFVFLIAIVLFNLLNGLAVSDTQAIKSDAELVGYISRVKLISYIETMIIDPLPSANSIWKLNMLSCFENSKLSDIKNKILSKRINIFQDMSNDCIVKILPNMENRVELNSYERASQQKTNNLNLDCYKNCVILQMDNDIVNCAKDILRKKKLYTVQEEIARKRMETEAFLITMIKECHESLVELKSIMSNNKK